MPPNAAASAASVAVTLASVPANNATTVEADTSVDADGGLSAISVEDVMELTIAEELSQAFDLASLRKEAKTLKLPHQWFSAFKLQLRCDVARGREQRLFENRYEARVETARRRLVDEAGSIARDFKHPAFGEDRFDADTTLRQAQRDVHRRHLARIEGVDRFERQGLRDIVERSMRENLLIGKSREAFQRTTDRRSHQDRRHGRPRQRE